MQIPALGIEMAGGGMVGRSICCAVNAELASVPCALCVCGYDCLRGL
jgi:hypothetical protein